MTRVRINNNEGIARMGKVFYVERRDKDFRAPKVDHPYFILLEKAWDDYGSKSLYKLEYFEDGSRQTLGDVKIISKTQETAVLDDSFNQLDKEYLSLGQSLNYYKNFHAVFQDKCSDLLVALNDAVLLPGLRDGFEGLFRYTNSLIRTNEAQRALQYGPLALQGRPVKDDYVFRYMCDIPGADRPVELTFDFDPNDVLPHRVHGLIGRNGVGKTAILARLAMDLASPGRTYARQLSKRDQAFYGDRPLFSRIIALSFSAFDEFKRPKLSENISYIYCGVKDDEGRVTKPGLKSKHLALLDRVREIGHHSLWRDFVSEIIGSDTDMQLYVDTLTQPNNDELSAENVVLSSGQNTLIYCISALLAYAKPGALVLFDEPELHLHPNAVAQLVSMLQEILKRFDCYAILATHSPLVLQEIPSKRVSFLKRTGNLTMCTGPLGETFGEDISPLTEMVFETVNVENFFKTALNKIAKKHSFEEALMLFENRLSLNATAYLRSRYTEDDTNAYDDSKDR